MRASEEYHELARECLDWSRSAKSEHERKFFLQIAEAWLQAALAASSQQDRDRTKVLEAHVH